MLRSQLVSLEQMTFFRMAGMAYTFLFIVYLHYIVYMHYIAYPYYNSNIHFLNGYMMLCTIFRTF